MGSFCLSHFNASTARAITASSFATASASAEDVRVGDLQETTREFMKAAGDDLSHLCDVCIDDPRPQLNAGLQICGNRRSAFALGANCLGGDLVNLLQFQVTKSLGALTKQVAGNLKTVFTAVLGVIIFKNVVTNQALAGYSVTILVAGVV